MPNKKLEAFRVGAGSKRDRRVKLTPEDKRNIIQEYSEGATQRGLARKYNVSRRLINFIVKPENHLANLQARAERGGSAVYYDKESHRVHMAEHRKYKRQLMSELDDTRTV